MEEVPEEGSAAPITQARRQIVSHTKVEDEQRITIAMVSDYDDFVLDVPRDDTKNIPDRHDLVIDCCSCSVTKLTIRTQVWARTIVDQRDRPIQSTLLYFLEKELSIGP